MMRLFAFFEDCDEETCPSWESLAGSLEDRGVTLDVYGGDEGLGG